MDDYKQKIRKLLALAESPNENEAMVALLKARSLMAEHKISEKDLQDLPQQSVIRVKSKHAATKQVNPWILSLSAVIGEHYCCQAFRTHYKRSRTYYVGFIGFREDAEMCNAIFNYAVDCVKSNIAKTEKDMQQYFIPTVDIRRYCNSYGYGFTDGLCRAYEKQNKDNPQEFGLMLTIPKEVQEASQDLGHKEFKSNAENEIDAHAFWDGYKDGESFDPSRRVEWKKRNPRLLDSVAQ